MAEDRIAVDPDLYTTDGPYYPDDWQSQVVYNSLHCNF
ncbi:Protein of unknown function DUF3468 [Penicillium brevicompactum]|uniref:Uncharacterized protein n=1 Tax=Penicillium brevicompactum TaxID=5074 RepID=A0A9W9UMF9_PENBR|nr:Protein of unknown function DUF3468 [Penicillium brevicompactum]